MNEIYKQIVMDENILFKFVRKSVLTLNTYDINIDEDFGHVEKLKGSLKIPESFSVSEAEEKTKETLSTKIDDVLNVAQVFIVVYKISQKQNDIPLNLFTVEYVAHCFNYDVDELKKHKELYQHIKQSTESDDDDTWQTFNKVLEDSDIPQQVEQIMGNELDLIKFYDENYDINNDEYYEIKIWGSSNIRMVEQ